MRTLLKIAKYVLIITTVLVVLAIGSLFAMRTWSQHVKAEAFAIRSANGVDEAGYVNIGGIAQWIQARGQNRDNPILLCVHGGPGATLSPLTELFLGWEKDFTVVQWDQRGAGKSLSASGAAIAETMSVDRMTRDGIEVAEYLRTHFHKDKIILLGHSWGSILGINMSKRRPDLFHAYVGTGQASDLPRGIEMEYGRLLEQAQTAKDQKNLQALRQIGAPPFDTEQKIGVFFGAVDKYRPPSDRVALEAMIRSASPITPPPNFSLRDAFDRFKGFTQVPTLRLYKEMLGTRLASLGPNFDIPMVFIQGTDDNITQAALAEEYFKTINAPHKEMVLLEGGGHFAFAGMGDRFLKELVTRVRPKSIKQ